MPRKKLFFLFIDGVGIGHEHNPISDLFEPFIGYGNFTSKSLPIYREELSLFPVDACLGVGGTPQSATGQTTIMTGVNAPKILGYHLLAFPNETLLPLIQEKSILKKLSGAGIRVTAANLYSESFFRERKKRRRNMLPVSTLSIQAAGIPFRYVEEYKKGEAVFADITNEMLVERGFEIPLISPQEAAERINKIFEKHDFVFFEYFLTDTYGHSRVEEKIRKCVSILNGFMSEVWEGSKREIDILVTSDHGNAEDMSTGGHTLNPVPFLFLSSDPRRHEEVRGEKQPRDLTGLSPFISRYYGLSPD